MALTVEDGTGLAGADAYVDVATLVAYATARGVTLTGDTAAREAAIRRGTRGIDLRFAGRWAGVPKKPRDQALAWPRLYAYDSDGAWIDSATVPREVKDAACEAAIRELASPNSLLPDSDGSRIVSETVGPISTTWADDGYRSPPELPAIDRLVANLLTGSGRTKFAMRA